MNDRAFQNQRTRRGLAAPSLLLCLVFAISAMAQVRADRPLTSAARNNLIAELKEVVAKTVPDGPDAAAVAAKWDQRKGLAGKTKRDIIDVLYADLKTVISDSGARYQIYSMFSFYKTIPDAMFSKRPQKTVRPLSKTASITKLVDLTVKMHPYVGIDEELALLPGAGDVKAAAEKDRQNRIAGFDDALKTNNTLTEAQKAFVRANYDRLFKISDKITDDAIRSNFPTERWIRDGLSKSFAANFTAVELATLIAYFQQSAGRQYLHYVRVTNMAEMIKGNGGSPDITASERSEYERLSTTVLGEKFEKAFMHEAIEYEQAKENAVRGSKPNADGFAIYKPENLNKLFNKFVAENFRR